jgi:hypothetical protein
MMDPGNWIFLAQTCIVFLTGLIVLWYTFETHKLRRATQQQLKSAQKSQKIAATTALLAGYVQYLAILEQENNAWMMAGKTTRNDTSDLAQKIDSLEKELNLLMASSDV